MPLFRHSTKPPPPPSIDLPPGEEVEHSVKATLLQGKTALAGTLFLTNRRLLFEAKGGDAKWMSVPHAEIKAAGLYAWPGATMGRPSSRKQCLFIETTKGEQVWCDFGASDERAWLPLVQAHADSARAQTESDTDSS